MIRIGRLSENAHLPFDRLTVLSEVEGLRYPYPSSLQRMNVAQGAGRRAQGNEKIIFSFEPCALCLKPLAYASFLGISEALHLDIFKQPL